MKAFADLYAGLEVTDDSEEQVQLLTEYLRRVTPEDAAWALVLLNGGGPPKTISPRRLRTWICDAASIPGWLFTECRKAVTDLAETAALLYPARQEGCRQTLQTWIEDRLLPLANESTELCQRAIVKSWGELDEGQLVVWNKLLIGSLRPPIQRRQIAQALAELEGGDSSTLEQKLEQGLEPTVEAYRALLKAGREASADIVTKEPEAMQLDAVLIYARRGRGKRAAYYCDLTFGLWQGESLVPFARTWRGLSDDELRPIDVFVRRHIVDRFGPVRAVESSQVFTLSFDGLERAPRRKSGLKVRTPRIIRWRTETRPEQANHLEDALALLED